MAQLQNLINISQYYGRNPAYVLAGGGNTSFKTNNELYIKASGIPLSDIQEGGFVTMSIDMLNLMGTKEYPADPVSRETEVKEDLNRAIISPKNLRPSVETSLHNLLRHKYVVHTHPTIVNAMLCAKNAKVETEERFGSEALFIEYTDPGYILFKKLQKRLEDYEAAYNSTPNIILLQNHGIIVGADNTQEVKSIYDAVESRIRNGKELTLPKGNLKETESDTSGFISRYYQKKLGKDFISKAFNNRLTDYFSRDLNHFQKISTPLTPDIIVYCKSKYLFLEKGLKALEIEKRLNTFENKYGYIPKVIVVQQEGLVILEENEKTLRITLDVYYDMMKISYLAEQFGGPQFMSERDIAFIDNWEVENYRRSVANTN